MNIKRKNVDTTLEYVRMIDEYQEWAEDMQIPKRNPIVGEEMERAQVEMCRQCTTHERCEKCPGVSGWMKGREPYADRKD